MLPIHVLAHLRSTLAELKKGIFFKTDFGNVRPGWHIECAAMTLRLQRRSEGVAPEVRDIAWKAQRRLHQRWGRMRARGKSLQTTVVALARELIGFVWAIGQQVARVQA